jgi:hypothetical protein
MPQSEDPRLRKLLRRLRLATPSRSKEPEPPIDSYAYVTAPKKPRPSKRSGAAVAEYLKTDLARPNYCRKPASRRVKSS